MSDDALRRFSSRVDAYVRYRPSYPDAVFDALRSECGWSEGSLVADIGSGTGIATRMLLDRGHRVYAVEPNREMRQAAERILSGRPGFTSVDGRAEVTGLPDACVDGVLAAQAFHWFDHALCRREFVRILRPGGGVTLLWNERIDTTAFLQAYEQVLRTWSTDYAHVDHRAAASEAVIRAFFDPNPVRLITFPNWQDFDLDGLCGRAMSSSYAPEPDDPRREPFLRELGRIFAEHAAGGTVRFEYVTKLYSGRLGATPGGTSKVDRVQ
jgi:SAM-dependent methyltransferase